MKKKPSKKKLSKADILRKWGIPEERVRGGGSTWLRYKNPIEKGLYWYWLSIYIRQRDIQRYGTCISCETPITMENCDAGRFAPAGSCGRDLIMDPKNLSAECSRCNCWDEGHLIGYRRGLIERYGENHVKDLEDRYLFYRQSKTPQKDWKKEEYQQKIKNIWVLLREMGVECPDC